MQTPHSEPTVAAIATPPGPGGIGIIRLSGPQSLAILRQIFEPQSKTDIFTSHRMYYGWIRNPGTGQPLDEVLAVYMRGPHSYTRQDVVEIHCHGSYLVLEEVLAVVLSCGAILAAPGEFTKLAFLNGRIDLTRAEAVLELLTAKSHGGLHMAMSQLRGLLFERITAIRETLIGLLAVIEVAIDFPEEDVEILDLAAMGETLEREVMAPFNELIASADQGRIYRDGIGVVILGRPNVGKSSLLNALLREERAIVTAIPGTTRDTIEEYLDIKGIPVRIVDTAGIRESGEAVEEIGIERARRKLAEADLVLLLLDAANPVAREDYELFAAIGGKAKVVVANKWDLVADPGQVLAEFAAAFPGVPTVPLSAKTGAGIAELENVLYGVVVGEEVQWDPGHSCVPNVRHAAALAKARAACDNLAAGFAGALPADLLAIDLQEALAHLGEIIGETSTEDVLDRIFHEFCIGK